MIPSTKKKILVVDDNRVMLNFLVKTLEKDGHEVVSAEDGFSALETLTSFIPDIIFVDLIMPKISGDKLCQIVRKMKHLEHCYLVVVSAAVAEMEFDYTEIGANKAIAKGPFGAMAKHVLAAVKESDAPQKIDPAKAIVGLEAVDGVPVYARQMTRELLSRNRHLETILESMAEGILEVYSQRVVYANSAAVFLFGIPQEKLLASYPPDLFDNTAGVRVESLLQSKNGDPTEIGQNTPIELNNRLVTVKNIPVKGQDYSTILLITDVTERRRLQMQLQHVQKMKAIGTIASGVAHNFRNTLAGILTNSQVIQMNCQDGSGLYEVAERINTSVKRGVQLIDGLMQFSRKQIKNKLQRLNLVTVIHETYELIKGSFDKRIDIQIDVPDSLPVKGDHSGLSLALMNLCTNARDAMQRGGVLRIKAMEEGNMAVVVVSDTGHGMDPDTVEKCFDPFFTTKEVGKGTGLGLSTTYGIVKSHEGEIRVSSEPNKGSTFKLYLPLDRSTQLDIQEDKFEIVRGKGEKILLVDDEIAIQKAMPDLLEKIGYQLAIAGNGIEAIETYKTWRPDVVLMDINMPAMDGFTCVEKIIEYDPEVKVVIISGYEENMTDGLNERTKKCIKGYLVKPVEIHNLSFLLAQLLNSNTS